MKAIQIFEGLNKLHRIYFTLTIFIFDLIVTCFISPSNIASYLCTPTTEGRS